LLQQLFKEYFVFYKPLQVVSGDFYWVQRLENGDVLWAVVDCTGHGVPGAFMNMIGNRLLNKVVIEDQITEVDQVLSHLREGVLDTLQKEGKEKELQDGMDMGLVKIKKGGKNSETLKVDFSGAKSPLYVVNDNIVHRAVSQKADNTFGDDLMEVKGDPQPIGYEADDPMDFTKRELDLQQGDMLYLFTDGYPDQFGGPKGKKYLYGRYR
jgi:serine phosphatase RsbU (regulator of sigma subunit)